MKRSPDHQSLHPGDTMSAEQGSATAVSDRAGELNVVIRVIAEALVEHLHQQLQTRGYPDVNAGHGRSVLAWVDENGARPGEIARASRLTRAAVAERIAEITKMGYIETVPIPNDGRGKLVVLTERGRQLREAYVASQADVDEMISRLLGEDRFAQFRSMLDEIADSLVPEWREDRLGMIPPQPESAED